MASKASDMAACVSELSVRDNLAAIKAVITDLSRSEEEVLTSISELASLLFSLAQHSSSEELRNITFSVGIVKALLGIMTSSTNVALLTKTLQCIAFLLHGNEEARVRLGEMGIVSPLLKLLSPLPSASSDPHGPSQLRWSKERMSVYEQGLIALRKLTFHNLDNQQQVAVEGGLKLIIDISMDKTLLQNSGCFSTDAKEHLSRLTVGRKFICRASAVPENCRGAVLKSFVSLCDPGPMVLAQYPAFYVELATEEEEWVEDAMIEKGVVWPDHTPFLEHPKLTCVNVTSIEDGGNLWCQFCTEKPNKKVETLKGSLLKLRPPSTEPQVSLATVGDVYAAFCDPSLSKEPCCLSSPQWCRSRLLGVEDGGTPGESKVKVLAVDFGFSMILPLSHLAPLPMECRGVPPQAIPCKLVRIAPLPVSFILLENAAAVLCNMSFERDMYRGEIKTFKGIEALLRLIQCPHLAIVGQSVGALMNMSCSEKLQDEIGRRGAITVLLYCKANLARLIQDKNVSILLEILAQEHSEKVLRCASKLHNLIEPYAVGSCHRPALVHNTHKQMSTTRAGSKRSPKSVYRCLGDEDSSTEIPNGHNISDEDSVDKDSWLEVMCEPSGSISAKRHFLFSSTITPEQADMDDDTVVCIDVVDISTLARRVVIRAICALKNTSKQSKILIGVKKNGQVCGVKMDRGQRDRLCVGIGEVMTGFTPYVEPSEYHLLFVPVVLHPAGQRTDRYVVELHLRKSHYPQVYTISEKEDGKSVQRCYYRVAGRNDRLSCQELRDTVAWEEAHKYELQIKGIEENISKLETLLAASAAQCTS